jgi:hypothetical protein
MTDDFRDIDLYTAIRNYLRYVTARRVAYLNTCHVGSNTPPPPTGLPVDARYPVPSARKPNCP